MGECACRRLVGLGGPGWAWGVGLSGATFTLPYSRIAYRLPDVSGRRHAQACPGRADREPMPNVLSSACM